MRTTARFDLTERAGASIPRRLTMTAVRDGLVDGSLEGVIATRTAIAHVDGRRGVALVRGYPLPALAARCSYEDVAHLVLHGELPRSDAERTRFAAALR